MRFALIIGLLLAACSKSEVPSPPAVKSDLERPPETEQASGVQEVGSQESPASPALASPSVELIAPGEGPHRVLRWKLSPGAQETVSISTQSTSTGHTGAGESPAVIYELRLSTSEVSDDGVARVTFDVTEVEVADPPPDYPARRFEALKASVFKMKRKQGTYSVDSYGVLSAVRLEPKIPGDDGVEQLLRRLLYLTTLPLPAEKVGKGAKWTVTRAFEASGIRMQETATVELKQVEGNSIRADVKIVRSAPQQRLTRGPGIPPGGALTVLGVASNGTAVGEWELTRLATRSTKTHMSMTTRALLAGPDGSPLPMDIRRDTVQVTTLK